MKPGIVVSGALFWVVGASYPVTIGPPELKDPRSSSVFEPKQIAYPPVVMVHATGYCPCPLCCGKWSGGPTASGVMPIEGLTIAADKNIFPFGTCLKLPELGQRIVHDTGSAIKTFRIDVFFKSHLEALEFGFKRNLLVEFCD